MVAPRARSNYVTRAEALSLGLASADGDSFILRADDTTTLTPGGKGRNSFRIISNNQYGTHVSVWVVRSISRSWFLPTSPGVHDWWWSHSFDMQHMPQGCG
jgi:hypothetical protein